MKSAHEYIQICTGIACAILAHLWPRCQRFIFLVINFIKILPDTSRPSRHVLLWDPRGFLPAMFPAEEYYWHAKQNFHHKLMTKLTLCFPTTIAQPCIAWVIDSLLIYSDKIEWVVSQRPCNTGVKVFKMMWMTDLVKVIKSLSVMIDVILICLQENIIRFSTIWEWNRLVSCLEFSNASIRCFEKKDRFPMNHDKL